MIRSPIALALVVSLICAACASTPPYTASSGQPGDLTADRGCASAQWHKKVDGTIWVSTDNNCGKLLTCDFHLSLPIAGGSTNLNLNCLNQNVSPGHTDEVCKWTGQPVTVGGSGSMTCK
jgi:hypothetical protein